MTNKKIWVYADWEGLGSPLLMGHLFANQIRGKEIFSFEYTREWLRSPYAQNLDPDLQLYTGPQFLRDEKYNFGLFSDSSPDRWGRVLMRRREAAMARRAKRAERRLFESDYLLGVFDGHRMGALRFKANEQGPFLNHDREFATPPWTSLRELEHASLQIERDNIIDDPSYLKWLILLIAPGSSLGGARPKASVMDKSGQLWVAKFPSRNDGRDIGAWEMIVHEMGLKANLNLPKAMTQRFTSRHHSFFSKRFDRTSGSGRVHFASAMTLLGYRDGVDATEGVSYLELAEFIMQNGASADRDLIELWRRIVFSICVSNTDDHLRNHGFLLTPKGWVLSPAYDINPDPLGTGLSLNISENDNTLSLDLAMEVAEYFRLDGKNAKAIISKIQSSVADWRLLAKKYRIPRSEQDQMANAFEHS